MTITRVHHVGLHVSNLAASLAFYRDLLGLEVVWERVVTDEYVKEIVNVRDGELHQAMLRIPGSTQFVELIDYRRVDRATVDPAPPTIGTAHICLVVSEVQPLYSRLMRAGVQALSEPVAVPRGPNQGAIAVYVRDPDGFCVELLEPA